MKEEKRFIEGNIAIVEGALAAGTRFYAGYPISPSTEIAEYSSVMLPKVGGIYIQMEDELSSIAALLGASAAGEKAYTATSGPGFSLMSENLGLGYMSEIPAVIINVQRCGPSTSSATKPAQGDMMQARWGTHGDHGVIALSPASVQECFDLTVRAFNLAEKYRMPVYLMTDEAIGHLRETVTIRDIDPSELIERRQPDSGTTQENLRVYDFSSDLPAPMPAMGSREFLSRTTGSTHDEKGEFNPTSHYIDSNMRYLTRKTECNRSDICMTKEFCLQDAEIVFIAYGCTVRSALAAMDALRADGVKAGTLQLQTVWPFPKEQVRAILSSAKTVLVPELNLGQIVDEVRSLNDYGCQVLQANRTDGILITPEQIISALKEDRSK